MTYLTIFSILDIEVVVTKISFANNDCFGRDKDANYKLTRKSKIGPVLLSFAIATTILSTSAKETPSFSDFNVPSISTLSSIEYDSNDINNLNIIINDDDCSDTLFRGVCEKLEEDGIKFTTSKDSFGVNVDNSTVITLDQQYSAGENTLVFAPYDNTRIGNSDSLAVAMMTSFENNGFKISGLSCSQTGYVHDENGNVCCEVPTDTEKEIDVNNDTSFVTISFGTHNVNAEAVAKSIEEGLARQKHYLDTEDSNIDLVYRANGDEEINMVAEYFGTNQNDLKKYNRISSSTLGDSQAIINPQVDSIDSFSKDCNVVINKSNNKVFQ